MNRFRWSTPDLVSNIKIGLGLGEGTVTEHRITQIPLPGGSGRIPTGAMQFQDDWPGLFIRGDDAIVLMVRIRHLLERLAEHEDTSVTWVLLHLRKLADLIERDVIVP
jgi:hypothetical protein